MESKWVLGLTYIFAVGAIWIAASFVVQSVVDAGVSPFLITYTCNSLFVIYIPLVEIGRYVEDTYGILWFWQRVRKSSSLQEFAESEKIILLEEIDEHPKTDPYALVEDVDIAHHENAIGLETRHVVGELDISLPGEEIVKEDTKELVDTKGRWTRTRTAKVSLLICPFWFLAQLAFNLSLKYTTVTSNTILSSSSSLFTFMVALAFLGEKFTWLKLMSVLLCMGGTIIVSLGDSQSDLNAIASNPFLGDILALLSAALYAAYITLIRKKLPDDDEKSGRPSMALFLGFLGLFNLFIFLPIALILNFSKLEPFYILTWKQVGLIVGKGLLDNVLSDYLWAKAVLLTSTTVATAGLTIQVPMAAVVDSLTGNVPHLMDYIGALAVMIGFAGMNVPSELFSRREEASVKLESENASSSVQDHNSISLTAVAVT